MRNGLVILCFFMSLTLSGQDVRERYCVDPTMKSPLIDTISTVYCSAFVQAWIELQHLHKGAIKLDSNSVLLEQLNSVVKNNSVSADFLVARAGYIKDSIIAEINSELEQKFHFTNVFGDGYNQNDIISYAYLKKQIEFYYVLQDAFNAEKLVFNGSDTVDFFGLRYPVYNPVLKSKLIIHNYKSNDDFILEIKTKDNKDQVYIAKMQPGSTLAASYNTIIGRIGLNDTSFIEEGEKIEIPAVSFSLEKDFAELKNRQVLNPGFEKYRLSEAKQRIDFSLNGKGISLESEAEVREVFAIVENAQRQFIFDKPFFIILRESGKTDPYFCIYIANAAFMTK